MEWQLQNCACAIDCSYVWIKTPYLTSYKDCVDEIVDEKVVFQAVVNFQGWFLDVFSGWPGSVHGTRNFSQSPLGRAARQMQFLQEPLTSINEYNTKSYLIEDAGYKLDTNILSAYNLVPDNMSQDETPHQGVDFLEGKSWLLLEIWSFNIDINGEVLKCSPQWKFALRPFKWWAWVRRYPTMIAALLYNIVGSAAGRKFYRILIPRMILSKKASHLA